MATKSKDAGALDGALDAIRKALGAHSGDFSRKAEISLDLLEESLMCLTALGLLSRASVEVQARTGEGKRFVQKFSLGFRKDEEDGEVTDVPYLKKSILEEDE